MKTKILINSLLLFALIALLLLAVHLFEINPIGIIFLLGIVVFIKKIQKGKEKNAYNLFNTSLLLVIFLAMVDIIVKNQMPFYFIPFSLIPMLATILFSDLYLSFLLSVVNSVLLILMLKGNVYLGILMLNSAVISSVLVFGIRRRAQIIHAGIIIGLIQLISLLFLNNFNLFDPAVYLSIFFNGLVCAVIVTGILPIFEYLFKTITNISLLELSDLNHPLLKAMIFKAPGTYHHSLIVGNLSEAACEAIGANALLARIGAYYHDIGKIEKAEYFSENQMPNSPNLGALAPSMSKLVVINHVKEGQELARKYKLNAQIIDFILEHHGTSLVYYFYRRALETMEDDRNIEEDFRYAGPKPKSKETAIVLLADSVEAASRTLKDPTPARIEELVHKIINNKFIDGQLDECDITLRDMEKISTVFIRILAFIYHARIAYPDNESANNHKKSAKKETPSQSESDQSRNS